MKSKLNGKFSNNMLEFSYVYIKCYIMNISLLSKYIRTNYLEYKFEVLVILP